MNLEAPSLTGKLESGDTKTLKSRTYSEAELQERVAAARQEERERKGYDGWYTKAEREQHATAAVAAFKEQAARIADAHNGEEVRGQMSKAGYLIRALPADSSLLAAHDERLLEPFRTLTDNWTRAVNDDVRRCGRELAALLKG